MAVRIIPDLPGATSRHDTLFHRPSAPNAVSERRTRVVNKAHINSFKTFHLWLEVEVHLTADIGLS